jgi:hypothetical protein
VTDVGDAVILKNLFEAMWAEGAVVVATSNRHPTELYKNGIQRELFVPCIKQIQVQPCVPNPNPNLNPNPAVNKRTLSSVAGEVRGLRLGLERRLSPPDDVLRQGGAPPRRRLEPREWSD